MSQAAVAELTVTLRQPAQLGDRASSDSVMSTMRYLSGAVVRGAFAARWLGLHGGPAAAGTPARARFERLFEGGIRFGPLFSGGPPVPLSVLRHKYPHTIDCPYVAVDRAVTAWDEPVCTACGSPWEPAKGTVDGPVPHRRTHVVVGETQVAQRGGLYSRATLPAGASFTGHLVAGAVDLVEELAELDPIQVGGRRTTHGLAGVRIARNGALRAPTRLPDGRLVLTLRAPGVFVDDLGRPRAEPNRGELERLLGRAVTVQGRWIRWVTVGGWHLASGLPKPTELAVAAGSTYLLAPSGPVGDASLVALARRGLGLRRHEGFGDVGGAAVIPAGRAARDAEQRRITDLANSVAPLRGLQASPAWPAVRELLRSAAGRDEPATRQLRRTAAHWDDLQRRTLETFLTLDTDDARRVLDYWG